MISEIVVSPGQTLKDIANQYLGNWELWQQLADFNDLTAFDDISNLAISIPTEIESTVSSVLEGQFNDLSEIIKNANNWKSLEWI